MASLTPGDYPMFRARTALIGGVAAAVLGLGATALALSIEPARALLGYLAAYVAVTTTAVGGLILLMTGYATNARWPAAIRRVHESMTVVFPVLVVLFAPIAAGVGDLYVWADPQAAVPAHAHAAIGAKSRWLSEAAFIARGAVYLVLALAVAEWLRRLSRRQDRGEPSEGEAVRERARLVSLGLLPVIGLAITFAAFDWVMSLDPTWFSSMFGIYVFAGGFSSAIGLVIVLAWRARETEVTAGAITPHHFHALGRLLLAFVVFWAYAAYFQGFLIQIADRPSEVTFYIARLRGGWGGVLWFSIIAQFALPFVLLLPRRLKLRPRYLASVSALVVLGHLVDVYWLVMPSALPAFAPSWIDLAPLIGIAGACVAVAAWRQRGVPSVTARDPYLVDAIDYQSPL
ncbi:MAG: hypothetical protein AB7O24_01485 [Kofleriaceae bacterium]